MGGVAERKSQESKLSDGSTAAPIDVIMVQDKVEDTCGVNHVASDVASHTLQEPSYHGNLDYCLPCKHSSMTNSVGSGVTRNVVSQMYIGANNYASRGFLGKINIPLKSSFIEFFKPPKRYMFANFLHDQTRIDVVEALSREHMLKVRFLSILYISFL
jgi:hypothetical protein